MMLTTSRGLLVIALIALFVLSAVAHGAVKGTTYDGRSLIINGKRLLLFSGSIHYPRSPPEYNFEGNYDVVKFIKIIGKHDMYATLRVGPFIDAEWNYGIAWERESVQCPWRTTFFISMEILAQEGQRLLPFKHTGVTRICIPICQPDGVKSLQKGACQENQKAYRGHYWSVIFKCNFVFLVSFKLFMNRL